MRLSVAHERLFVVLVCVHSIGVGLILMLVPQWAVRFGGWNGIDPEFFARQAGIFHVVLVTGYALEYIRHRTVLLIVTAKSIALVFLLGVWAFTDQPWAVPVSGVADGLMGAILWWIHRIVHRDSGAPASS